jgi:hypothetical protein
MDALLALALALSTAASTSQPPSVPDRAATCREAAAITDHPACAGVPLCSARERLRVVCELGDALESRYVFTSVKSALLAGRGGGRFDARRHLDGCVARERAVAREADPLRFYDRMRACLAGFEDGHLIASVPGKLPAVALGLSLRLAADGKVYLASRTPAVVDWLRTEGGVLDADAVLATGTEVVAVDGEPVALALARLAAYVPASSAPARLERAVDALTRRDFAYPTGRTATLTVNHRGSPRDLALRWWIAPSAAEKPVAAAFLGSNPLASTSLVDWSGKPRWAPGGPEEGASRGDPILSREEALALQEYRSGAGHVAARMGEGTARDGEPFCYVQLLTLHTETLAAREERRPFVAVVEEFIRGCDSRQRDLVLDLRQNEGGYISHSSALARLLTPRGASVARGALLLAANDHNERVFRARAPSLGAIRAVWNGARSEIEEMLDALRDARPRADEFTPAFLERTPQAEVAGYGGRTVALIAPTCMSACERLAGMLQSAGVTLVGGPTEGAGGSQQEAKGLPARWTDASRRLAVSVPTAAMGIAPGGTELSATVTASRFFAELSIENRPIAPDVPYATTRDDLTRSNAGWREAAEAALRLRRPQGKSVADGRSPGGNAVRPPA